MNRAMYLASVVVASLAVGVAPAAASDTIPDHETRAPKWVPRFAHSAMTNADGFYDVNYQFSFYPADITGQSRAGAMTSDAFSSTVWKRDLFTMEIGWKKSSKPGCRNATSFLQVGFPSSSRPQVDYEEDSSDAVLWFTDLYAMKQAQRDDPSLVFKAFWDCESSDVFDHARESGPFEVQLGHSIYAPPEPAWTFSDETYHLFPAEQSHLGIPYASETAHHLVRMDSPWPLDWQFEASRTSSWRTSGTTLTNYCCNYDAPTGGGYLYVKPDNPVHSYVGQLFAVRTNTQVQGQSAVGAQLGSNTDYHLDGWLRCPTWSPRTSGKTSDACRVTFWLKTEAHPSWSGQGFSVDVPADGRWYYVDGDPWGAQTSDDEVRLWIDTNGYHVDLDGIWVSSGI